MHENIDMLYLYTITSFHNERLHLNVIKLNFHHLLKKIVLYVLTNEEQLNQE